MHYCALQLAGPRKLELTRKTTLLVKPSLGRSSASFCGRNDHTEDVFDEASLIKEWTLIGSDQNLILSTYSSGVIAFALCNLVRL